MWSEGVYMKKYVAIITGIILATLVASPVFAKNLKKQDPDQNNNSAVVETQLEEQEEVKEVEPAKEEVKETEAVKEETVKEEVEEVKEDKNEAVKEDTEATDNKEEVKEPETAKTEEVTTDEDKKESVDETKEEKPVKENVKKKKTDKNAPRTITNGKYTIVKGDCLWNIAKDVYGDPLRYVEIYEANRDVLPSADLIFVGTTIVIP